MYSCRQERSVLDQRSSFQKTFHTQRRAVSLRTALDLLLQAPEEELSGQTDDVYSGLDVRT